MGDEIDAYPEHAGQIGALRKRVEGLEDYMRATRTATRSGWFTFREGLQIVQVLLTIAIAVGLLRK